MQATGTLVAGELRRRVAAAMVTAVVTAFAVGSVAGYGIRAVTYPIPEGAAPQDTTKHPFVVESPPYQTPRPPAGTSPTPPLDPAGNVIPI